MKRILLVAALVLLCAAPSWGFGFGFGFGTWFGGKARAQWVDLVQSLSWVSTTYDFGSVNVGESAYRRISVVNSGNDTAEDVTVKVVAPFALCSTAQRPAFGNISASRTRHYSVRATPTGAGAFGGAAFGSYSAPNIARVDVALSGTGVAPAAAPTTPIITATAGDTLVTIAKTSSEAGSPVPSYDLKRGTVSGTRSVVASAISLPYSDTGRTNGTPYYYSLVATNTAGTAESDEVSATPVGLGDALAAQLVNHASTSDVYDTHYSGQSFTVVSDDTSNQVKLWATTVNGVGGTLEVRIGSSADLSTYTVKGTLSVTSVNNATEITVILDSPTILTAGTWYLGVVGPTGFANRLTLGRSSASNYAGGVQHNATAGWPIVVGSGDLYFEVR